MKTIDVLILEELLASPSVTAQFLSQTWGEDVTRCYDWLRKFEKRGLCVHDGVAVGRSKPSTGRLVFTGRPAKIREVFLAKSMKS